MIIKNQSNLKVHFAGAERLDRAMILNKIGVKYQLFTAYSLLCDQIGHTHYPILETRDIYETAREVTAMTRHSIMDSGLFTLMFGAQAGKKDAKFLDKWYQILIRFINKSKYQGTCVEIDCQKVLGVSKAWEYRQAMRKDIKNRIINVFHLEDAQKGLDKLIEYSDYIAISVPELRKTGKRDYCIRLGNYIKNKKPSIDIHLLGCTDLRILRALSFCSSCDSTSWTSGVRYGRIGRYKTKHLKNDLLRAKYEGIILEMLNEYDIKITDSRILYYANYALSGEDLLNKYSHAVGIQN